MVIKKNNMVIKKNNDQMNESFGAHRSSCMEKRL